jgi:hypothetical protein
MKEKTMVSYADKLMNMADVIPFDGSNPLTHSHINTHYSFYADGFVYLLNARRYRQELLTPLLKHEKWGERCTEAFIQSEIQNIVRQALQPGKKGANGRAQKAFAKLATKVEDESHQYTVYLPLSNIVLEVEELAIGDVTLLTMTQELFEEIATRYTKAFKNDQFVTPWRGDFQQAVYARYTCYAHHDRAKERGIEACEQALELLRFAMQRMAQDQLSMTVDLLHEVPSYIRTILVSSPEVISCDSSVIGSLTPFKIDQQIRDQLNALGVFKVAALFQQDIEKDSFHDKLWRGIHWFSNAQKERIKENQFLNLTTCLETFLGSKEEDITQTVARGVAVVLAITQEERESHWRRMKELYDHRSALSHGSRSTMLASDLDDLWDFTGAFLAHMIQRIDEFVQHQDALREWIDSQQFTPGAKCNTTTI